MRPQVVEIDDSDSDLDLGVDNDAITLEAAEAPWTRAVQKITDVTLAVQRLSKKEDEMKTVLTNVSEWLFENASKMEGEAKWDTVEKAIEIRNVRKRFATDIAKNAEETCKTVKEDLENSVAPLSCPVCMAPYDQDPRRPHALDCGHVVCIACLERFPHPLCPKCRAPITPAGMRRLFLT